MTVFCFIKNKLLARLDCSASYFMDLFAFQILIKKTFSSCNYQMNVLSKNVYLWNAMQYMIGKREIIKCKYPWNWSYSMMCLSKCTLLIFPTSTADWGWGETFCQERLDINWWINYFLKLLTEQRSKIVKDWKLSPTFLGWVYLKLILI